jgi:hypothetical protein
MEPESIRGRAVGGLIDVGPAAEQQQAPCSCHDSAGINFFYQHFRVFIGGLKRDFSLRD